MNPVIPVTHCYLSVTFHEADISPVLTELAGQTPDQEA